MSGPPENDDEAAGSTAGSDEQAPLQEIPSAASAASAAPAAQAEQAAPEPVGPAAAVSSADRRKNPRGPRPSLAQEVEPVYRDSAGFRMRIEPRDLAKLRELPASKGKTDRDLGEEFFDGQIAKLAAALTGDVIPPAEVRVVVDPYSRQAFLAVGQTIRGIVSF